MFVTLIQVSQIESENKRKRSRHAPQGQRAHSPGHRPGYDEAMKCALKGQKHYRATVYREAFALSGRVFKTDVKNLHIFCL